MSLKATQLLSLELISLTDELRNLNLVLFIKKKKNPGSPYNKKKPKQCH